MEVTVEQVRRDKTVGKIIQVVEQPKNLRRWYSELLINSSPIQRTSPLLPLFCYSSLYRDAESYRDNRRDYRCGTVRSCAKDDARNFGRNRERRPQRQSIRSLSACQFGHSAKSTKHNFTSRCRAQDRRCTSSPIARWRCGMPSSGRASGSPRGRSPTAPK